jgi:hypothetical protein
MAQAPQRKVNPTVYKDYATESHMDIDDPLTGRMDISTNRPTINRPLESRQTTSNIGSTMAILIGVLVVVLAGFYFFGNRVGIPSTAPGTVTEQKTNVPNSTPSVDNTQPDGVPAQQQKVDGTASTTSKTTP